MNKNLGAYVKESRENIKVSQRELAKKIGVDNATISKIESGKIEKPSFEILIKLSKELNISIYKLLHLSNYSDVERLIYSTSRDVFYENELLKNIDKTILDRIISYKNHESFLDIERILDEYKKNNISKMDTIKLLTVCKPIEFDNKIIYPGEKKDIIIEINDVFL